MAIPTISVSGIPDPLPEQLHVLDVRESDEWSYGHIDGAQHIPLMELPQRIHEVPAAQTLVVCRVGARSAQATAYLVHNGYDAVNLQGGLADWVSAGRPLVSDTDRQPRLV